MSYSFESKGPVCLIFPRISVFPIFMENAPHYQRFITIELKIDHVTQINR